MSLLLQAFEGLLGSLGSLVGVFGSPLGVPWGSLAVVWPLGCLGGARGENPGNSRRYFGGILEVFFLIVRCVFGLRFLIDVSVV